MYWEQTRKLCAPLKYVRISVSVRAKILFLLSADALKLIT